jgi:alkylation response protein AidB-like acyl-CoA dehydrogenase
MTDLLYSDVEEELRSSVRGVLAQRSPVSHILANLEKGEPFDANLWRTLATEMGLAGIAVPERLGGAGASLREAGVVLEELGRGVAPVPFLTSAIVATTVLARAGADDLVASLARGERCAALALPFSAGPTGTAVPSSTVDAEGERLTGRVTTVAGALGADLLVVPTDAGLFVVEAGAAGVSVVPVVSLDLTRPLADITFAGAPARLVADRATAVAAVSAALTAGAVLLASEQLGVAQWCLETTVEYLKTRYQFGRPIGSFQALKHRAADVWVDLTQTRAAARYAVVCAADDLPDLAVAAAVAQAHCSPATVKAAEECVQLHGGIGFTWEHPAHLYLKRAKSSALAFGGAHQHRVRLSTLVDLPA